MEHHFTCEIAALYGVNAAIILSNLSFWINKNKIDNRHFYDGRTWTYISREGLQKNFPYLSKKQIDYAIDKLLDEGIIITGNFNRHTFDKTKWYALTDYGEELVQKVNIDLTKGEHRCIQKVNIDSDKRETSNTTKGKHRTPQKGNMYNIYNNTLYSNTDINPYINHTDIASAEPTPDTDLKNINTDLKNINAVIGNITNTDLKNEIKEFCQMRRKLRKPLTPYALKLALKKLEGLSCDTQEQIKIVRQSIEHSWQSFYPLHKDTDESTNEMGETSPDQITDIERTMMRMYGGG